MHGKLMTMTTAELTACMHAHDRAQQAQPVESHACSCSHSKYEHSIENYMQECGRTDRFLMCCCIFKRKEKISPQDNLSADMKQYCMSTSMCRWQKLDPSVLLGIHQHNLNPYWPNAIVHIIMCKWADVCVLYTDKHIHTQDKLAAPIGSVNSCSLVVNRRKKTTVYQCTLLAVSAPLPFLLFV